MSLLLVGVVVLLWLPLSFPFVAYASDSAPTGFVGIGSGDGCVSAWLSQLPITDSSRLWRAGIVRRADDFPISWREVLLPTIREAGMLESRAAFAPASVSLPLWLLAFLCLAWPVTSFLLARRRRGRGFPVQPTTHD